MSSTLNMLPGWRHTYLHIPCVFQITKTSLGNLQLCTV